MGSLYGKCNISMEQIEYVVSLLNKSTNSYIYVIDLISGDYMISENAVKRFGFPSATGTDYFDITRGMIYSDDLQFLEDEINSIKCGEKKEHSMKYRWLSVEGEIVWISCRGQVIPDEAGRPRLLLGRISEMGNKTEADNITGLLRENRFEEYLDAIYKEGLKPSGSVIVIGLDDLRAINEQLGHRFGDLAIKTVAKCIDAARVPGELKYRTSGDGFIIYIPNITEEKNIVNIYKNIRKRLDIKIETEDFEAVYTISAGILLDISIYDSYESIMQYAEFSLKEAKRTGRNTFYVFNKREYNLFIYRNHLRKRLQKDISHDFANFELFYQPIVDAHTKCVTGAEALLRWKDEKGKYIPPSEFIPILEASGHIVPVGRWVMERALTDSGKWIESMKNFHINVNLSYVQLEKSDMADLIGIMLYRTKTPAGNLTIEITESGYVETGKHFDKFHSKAKNLGCKIAIDDFGTGYSNLRYMNEIDANTVKIDRSFTEKAMESDYDFTLIKNIIDMAHSMKINVCIEGVETQEELDKLSELNPDYFQGYFFGRPVPREEFEKQFLDIKENCGWVM